MFKILLPLLIMVTTFNTSAAIYTKTNQELDCLEYINYSTNEDISLKEIAKQLGATLLDESYYSGMSLKNLSIDFENNKVSAEIRLNVMFRFNPLLTGRRVTMNASNEKLTTFISYLNRKVILLSSVCINKNNEVITFTN